MSSERIVVLQPLSAGVSLVRRCVELGYACTVYTGLPEQVHGIDGIEVADWDVADGVDRLERDLREASPVAVIPGHEYTVAEAAELAGRLGLPGLDPEDARAARFKDLMRARLRQAGLRIPTVAAVTAQDDPADCAGLLPAVVKPVDAGGSVGVRLVDSADELVRACRAITAGDPLDQVPRRRPVAMVEEYVEGPELSLEGWVDGHGPAICSITEKRLSPPPFFVELGHLVGQPIDDGLRQRLEAYTRSVLSALGICLGPFHAEMRIGADGEPVLMEVAARLPGDRLDELIADAHGIDLLAATVSAFRGLPFERGGSAARGAGIAFVRPGQSGEFTGTIDGWPRIERLAEFRDGGRLARPGDQIDLAAAYKSRVAWARFAGRPERVRWAVDEVITRSRADVRPA